MPDLLPGAIASSYAVIFLAHGSRDPVWSKPIEQLAAHTIGHMANMAQLDAKTQRQTQTQPPTTIRCAYLEWTQPLLEDAADELVGMGISTIKLLPLFWGHGYHLGQEIPLRFAQLQARYPSIKWHLLPSPGGFEDMPQWMTKIIYS
jgi:sirohydrochlorin cobaltochelatase